MLFTNVCFIFMLVPLNIVRYRHIMNNNNNNKNNNNNNNNNNKVWTNELDHVFDGKVINNHTGIL